MKKYKEWQNNMQTFQSKEIISELSISKKHFRASLIISDTGGGKTNTVKLFKKTNPDHTYVVTVGQTYKLSDIIDELMMQFGIYRPMSKNMLHRKLQYMQKYLESVRKNGGKPLIIIDEAENLKFTVLKVIKQLYDAIIGYCSITLIGTDAIIYTMTTRTRAGYSLPQLYRRFKAGIRYISDINKARDFMPFFKEYIPNNKDVQDILLQLCENYGELHDFLAPVLDYCNETGKELDATLFRHYHKLPANLNRKSLK